MAISEISTRGAVAARQVRARKVLQQAEQRTGVNREAKTLPEGFYGTREQGLCGALGIPLGGSVAIAVAGSSTLLLALVAEIAAKGQWIAVVAMPSLGMAAAAELGVDLTRVALVDDPGAHAPRVLAALIDGFDVVVVGKGVRLGAGQRRSLLGRARKQRTAVVASDWPEVSIRVEAKAISWNGAGHGEGFVHEREIAVRKFGNGGERQIRLSAQAGRVMPVDRALRSVG